jgi:sec-independent protein translocase protein TatA
MHHTLPVAFIGMPGGMEWVVIGLVALLLFGKRLPGVAKSLGQAMHEFRSGLSGAADVPEEKKPDEKSE